MVWEVRSLALVKTLQKIVCCKFLFSMLGGHEMSCLSLITVAATGTSGAKAVHMKTCEPPGTACGLHVEIVALSMGDFHFRNGR